MGAWSTGKTSMKIAILGTRGIPANYSGFETSVEETSWRLAKRGHDVYVYCRTNNIETDASEYRGVKLIKLPSIQSKHLDTPVHTTLSVLHLFASRLRPDIIQVYGVGNSLWLPFLRLARVPIVSVVDGLDWQRRKWGAFAKRFLRFSEKLALRWSTEYVVDSQTVIKYYQANYKKHPVYIPYGANVPKTMTSDSFVREKGLMPNEYILFVGRLVPEKGVHHLISAFERVKTDKNLVIVGDNIHDREYVTSLKNTKDSRIRFLGFVYGESYQQLNSHAYIYVQPSELEGTSPALLGAMGFGNCVVVSDIPENLETIGNAGIAFRKNDPKDLADKLQMLIDNPSEVGKYKRLAIERVQKHYSWEVVTDQYEQLFYRLLNEFSQK